MRAFTNSAEGGSVHKIEDERLSGSAPNGYSFLLSIQTRGGD